MVKYNTFGPLLTTHTICFQTLLLAKESVVIFGMVLCLYRMSWCIYSQWTEGQDTASTPLHHTCPSDRFRLHLGIKNFHPTLRVQSDDTKQSGCSIFRASHMKALSDGRGYKQRISRCLHSSHLFISVSKTPIQWLFPTTCLTNLLPHIWYTARPNTLCSLEWIKLRWSACDDVYCITGIRSTSVSISKSAHNKRRVYTVRGIPPVSWSSIILLLVCWEHMN